MNVKAEMTNPLKRRFQFSLRTLLIVVTLLAIPCAYVGRQTMNVRARTAFIKDHPEVRFFLGDYPRTWLRKNLEDHDYEVVGLPLDAVKEEREVVARLFPEASIKAINDTYPWSSGEVHSVSQPMFIGFPDEARWLDQFGDRPVHHHTMTQHRDFKFAT